MNLHYFTVFSSPEQKAYTNLSYQNYPLYVVVIVETFHIFSIGPISIKLFLGEERLSLFKKKDQFVFKEEIMRK